MNLFKYFIIIIYVIAAVLAFYFFKCWGVDAFLSSIIISIFPEIIPKLKAHPLILVVAVFICFATYFILSLLYNNQSYGFFIFFIINLPVFYSLNFISNRRYGRDIVIVGWSGFNITKSHTIIDVLYSFVWIFLVIVCTYLLY